jgi:hypothetical protein
LKNGSDARLIAEHMPQISVTRAQLVEFPDDETCRIFYADRPGISPNGYE